MDGLKDFFMVHKEAMTIAEQVFQAYREVPKTIEISVNVGISDGV